MARPGLFGCLIVCLVGCVGWLLGRLFVWLVDGWFVCPFFLVWLVSCVWFGCFVCWFASLFRWVGLVWFGCLDY